MKKKQYFQLPKHIVLLHQPCERFSTSPLKIRQTVLASRPSHNRQKLKRTLLRRDRQRQQTPHLLLHHNLVLLRRSSKIPRLRHHSRPPQSPPSHLPERHRYFVHRLEAPHRRTALLTGSRRHPERERLRHPSLADRSMAHTLLALDHRKVGLSRREAEAPVSAPSAPLQVNGAPS